MATEKQEGEVLGSSLIPPRAQFVEVLCKSSGKMRRFAAGTAAGWALHRMNQTLDAGLPQGSLIEAVKEGEEPVTFGPSAVLAHYGQGWSLQTIPEEEERTSTGTTPAPSEFLEVKCKNTGKMWRFAAGTRAGYALLQMNQRLELGHPLGLGIEGVKEGEEPVRFGPDAILVGYGRGWTLQTVFNEGYGQARRMAAAAGPRPLDGQPNAAYAGSLEKLSGRPLLRPITPGYIGRIALAFLFMFFLGGLLTLFLEYLPNLLAFISLSA